MHVGARYYDPEVGRFTTADPVLGDIYVPQTLNRYAYVNNNPVNLVDPSGLQWYKAILGGAWGLLVTVAAAIWASTLGLFLVVILVVVGGSLLIWWFFFHEDPEEQAEQEKSKFRKDIERQRRALEELLPPRP